LRNSGYLNMDFTNSYSTFTENNRVLNEAINKLRECGSEAILGEMPKIAVIGNQSAGKSSLIEAMSGVPRSFLGVSDDRFESLVTLGLAPAVLWKWF
jgi:tRNA U34 5-carboxymethylaminomethyl modifying GTPase MnmE/TrmE